MDARGFRDGDEFDRAEVDDLELERAADRELRDMDRANLLGEQLTFPTMAEAIADLARARREAWRE